MAKWFDRKITCLFRKLAGKRGRKNQVLQLEVTELKDTLKVHY